MQTHPHPIHTTPLPAMQPGTPIATDTPTAQRIAQAWAVLHTVLDPEVPVLSVCDLGIVRDVLLLTGDADGVEGTGAGLEIVLTPTYSGCPATEAIEQSCREALLAAGLGPVRTRLQRAPAWTSDWISASGRDKLRDYGIAPPAHFAPGDAVPMRFVPQRHTAAVTAIACPRCASTQTERLSAFGATACKALYRCIACREPFEYFKPI